MIAYLDNAATTAMDKRVLEAMHIAFFNNFANPSSMHKMGYNAEMILKEAKKNIADIINADISEIIITSSATESINTSIYGACNYGKIKHFVSSTTEHSAVYNCLMEVKKYGNIVTLIDVDSMGLLREDLLEEELLKNEIDFFSLIWVNNEVGTIQDVEKIISLIRKIRPNCIIHLDATQAIGKIKVDVQKLNVDLISASAHKIHGPKGVGLLYKKKSCNIRPLIIGGGQQNGFRAGTENVAGTIGLSKAIQIAYEDFDKKQSYLKNLKERLISSLKNIDDVTLNTPKGDIAINNIISIAFENVRSEVLLHELASRGVYVSAGSACKSNSKNKGSRILRAMQVKENIRESTIRLSFSNQNSIDEIDYAIEQIKLSVNELRKYVRK